jgi:ferritin-like metal-binding protein YciE
MGLKDAAELLHATLEEEKAADEALSHIAVHNINWEATQEHA